MITLKKMKDLLVRLTHRNMEQVFDDWEMLVGFEAKAEAPRLELVESPEELIQSFREPHVVVETKIEGRDACNGPIYFVFPTPMVVEVIADLTMIPEGAKAAKAQGELDEEDLGAFREMANLLCGSSNQVFEKLRRDVRISQSVEHLKVWAPEAGKSPLERCLVQERLSSVTMEVASGDNRFRVLEVIPLAVCRGLAEQFYGTRAA